MSLPEFQYLHGKPRSSAVLKQSPENFVVDEDLGFDLSGEGEHLCLHVQKRNCNTHFVAEALAKWAKVSSRQVSHAGLKDRNALTTQWFSVQLPGKSDPDVSLFNEADIEILALKRHSKKIKTGGLRGNYFKIKLTGLEIEDDLQARLALVGTQGVPNYFGAQRFGFNGNNILHAKAMFAGSKVRSKTKRGLYLSAARSLLFNQVVSGRIEQNLFLQPVAGDLLQLSGSHSFFEAKFIDDDLVARLKAHEIAITSPLWGRVKMLADSPRSQLENTLLETQTELQLGLEAAGLEMARRAMVLYPQQFEYQIEGQDLFLSFYLPAGCYATSVIREIINCRDMVE